MLGQLDGLRSRRIEHSARRKHLPPPAVHDGQIAELFLDHRDGRRASGRALPKSERGKAPSRVAGQGDRGTPRGQAVQPFLQPQAEHDDRLHSAPEAQ
jgi:hypothetical protein